MTILCVVAHPDDETIGCGGTLAAFAKMGHAVYVGALADGETSRDDATFRDVLDRWRRWELALRRLGARPLYPHEAWPDQRLETIPRLRVTKQIARWLAQVDPHIVLTHSPHDPNLDHRMVWEAAEPALLRCPTKVYRFGVRRMRSTFRPVPVPLPMPDMVTRHLALSEYGAECEGDLNSLEQFEKVKT